MAPPFLFLARRDPFEHAQIPEATGRVMNPRYEYRVWAPDLSELAARLAAHCEPQGARAGEETYLVHPRADLNVKIRSGTLDIKQLVRIQQGFQLWTPIFKEAFPLSAASTAKAMGYLAVSQPSAGRDTPLDLDDFLVLAGDAGMATARVAKQRHGYLQEGCILEFAEVTINGTGVHSVAVESEDLDIASVVADRLGITERPNESYQQAIRRALGM